MNKRALQAMMMYGMAASMSGQHSFEEKENKPIKRNTLIKLKSGQFLFERVGLTIEKVDTQYWDSENMENKVLARSLKAAKRKLNKVA